MRNTRKIFAVIAAGCVLGGSVTAFAGCSQSAEVVTLRVSNWEEYVDLGGWGDDELIDIDNPYAAGGAEGIIGVNSMVDDFTEWFNSSHEYEIKVEYSTFGTNEDLYNRLSLGDEYDLVCPSDYMIMKLIDEGNFVEYSEAFRDATIEENYYAQYVSQYIDGDADSVFVKNGWDGIAACYMWGTTGLVYNPENLKNDDDISTFGILMNEDYNRRVTIKDNVRDAYFATLGIINADKLTSGELTDEERSAVLNDVDATTIAAAEDVLKKIKENVYSFETDSGKADMVTGKVIANYQWSGDAVYIMDEADGDETELWYSVPDECTNLWFDGWMMLKSGVGDDEKKREAAEAFVNFLSRPDNAVRNMYFIGYTSAIAGDVVLEYMYWNYGADDECELTLDYDLGYFFGGEDSIITADASQFELSNVAINRGRQLFAQYPSANVIERSVVMLDFGDKLGEINRMWINVRCLDLLDIPVGTVIAVACILAVAAGGICLYAFRHKLPLLNKPKKGYKKV